MEVLHVDTHSWSVKQLKTHIVKCLPISISTSLCRLSFAGETLQDEENLSHYGLKPDCTLTLLTGCEVCLKPPSAQKPEETKIHEKWIQIVTRGHIENFDGYLSFTIIYQVPHDLIQGTVLEFG